MAGDDARLAPSVDAERAVRWTIVALVAIGGALRLARALGRTDLVWPDEHWQTLEPAARAVLGRGIPTWEWQQGFRSWSTPAFFMPIVALGALVGASGTTIIVASRVAMALAGTWMLWRIDRTLVRLGCSGPARVVTVALIALSPAMILWGPTTLADNLCMILLWGGLPTVLRLAAAPATRAGGLRALALGVVVALPLLAKPQSLVLGAVVFLVLLVRRLPLRALVVAAGGYVLVLLALGALDWATWGAPFESLRQQLTTGAAIAVYYGVSPWWDYGPRVLGDLGAGLAVVAAALAVAAAVRWRALVAWVAPRRGLLALALLPSAAFVAVHMAIAHKETRYVLPAYPALFVAIGALVDALWVDLRARVLPMIARPRLLAGLLVLALALWIAVAGAAGLGAPAYLAAVDTIALEQVIADDGALDAAGTDCIGLVDHAWSWTRGALVVGRQVQWVESTERPIEGCRYAIVSGAKSGAFAAAHGAWTELARAPGGQVLFRRR